MYVRTFLWRYPAALHCRFLAVGNLAVHGRNGGGCEASAVHVTVFYFLAVHVQTLALYVQKMAVLVPEKIAFPLKLYILAVDVTNCCLPLATAGS